MTVQIVPVEVRLSECYCPESPHPDGDIFVLADELPIEAGVAASAALAGSRNANAAATLVGALARHGAIESWNLLDKDGDPVPITPDTVAARVTWLKGGVELSNAILTKYLGNGGGPLGLMTSPKTRSSSSRRGPTATSTSRKTSLSSVPQEPSA